MMSAGTRNWSKRRQWSAGTVPNFEEKQFMGEYNIAKLVPNVGEDAPQPGQAHIEAFFTAKGRDVFAIVPRRLPREVVLKDVKATGATLVETGDKLAVRANGGGLTVTVPDGLLDR